MSRASKESDRDAREDPPNVTTGHDDSDLSIDSDHSADSPRGASTLEVKQDNQENLGGSSEAADTTAAAPRVRRPSDATSESDSESDCSPRGASCLEANKKSNPRGSAPSAESPQRTPPSSSAPRAEPCQTTVPKAVGLPGVDYSLVTIYSGCIQCRKNDYGCKMRRINADAEFECDSCSAHIPKGQPIAYCENCDFCTCRYCTTALDRRVQEIEECISARVHPSMYDIPPRPSVIPLSRRGVPLTCIYRACIFSALALLRAWVGTREWLGHP